MAFEVPTDLIHQAQIGFREDAGLSSFDPKEPSLPPIPTVDASIAALDPSPPYLRCSNCKGKLLRGLKSLMCIYCGQHQKKNPPPDPISFNSTTGYRWLLQSLNLDGSGRVGPLTEGSGRNGRQSPAEDEITLSELLDLQISWRDEPEKPEIASDKKTFEHGSSSVNLRKVDLDNFFTGSQGDTIPVASEEQPVSGINDQSKAFGDQENLSLFQNVLPPETAVTSSVGVSGDASSGWDAGFQSGDSKMQNEDSKSVDPFIGAQVDLSAHMDSVFGNFEDPNNRKPNNESDSLPSTGKDWINDDLFANISSETFQQADQFNSVVQPKDGLSDHPNDASLEGAGGDWFKDSDWQKNSANDTAVSQQAAQLDLFTKPKDSPSLSNLNASSSEGALDWFESTNWRKNTTNNTATNKDDNTFDIRPMVGAASSPALVTDFFQSDLVNNASSSTSQHADRLDFDNSNKHGSDAADWFQDGQWQINASSSTNVAASKDDSFDEWNDFTSSSGNQDSFQDPWKQSSNENVAAGEKTPESSLFPSTTNTQEMDFGNFSPSDMFSGSSGKYNPNDSQAVNNILSEASTASRSAAEVGTNTEQPKNDEITPNSTTHPKNDVEILLSQMHDLSFMLKSELSIPSKPDDHGPPHN